MSSCSRCKIVDKCIAICLLMDQFIKFKEDFEFLMDYVLVWANKARIFMKLWPKKTDFPDHARDFTNDVCDLPLCFLLIFNIALYSRFALYVAFSTFSVKFSLFALYSQSPCNPIFTVLMCSISSVLQTCLLYGFYGSFIRILGPTTDTTEEEKNYGSFCFENTEASAPMVCDSYWCLRS